MNQVIMEQATALSRRLAKKWKGIDPDDIRQEVLVWCITRGIGDNLDEESEDYEADLRQAISSMSWAGERYCRREKAAKAGYSIEDEAYYGTKALEELLVNYFHYGIEAHAPIDTENSVRHQKTDGATSGNYLVSLMDVDRGLSLIAFHYRQRLEVRFGPLAHLSDDGIAGLSQSEIRDLTGWHHDRLALVLGSTGDKVRHRVDTALKALQRALGGPDPWPRSGRVNLSMVA